MRLATPAQRGVRAEGQTLLRVRPCCPQLRSVASVHGAREQTRKLKREARLRKGCGTPASSSSKVCMPSSTQLFKRLAVVFALLLVKLTLLLRRGILVLLVLRDEVVHVALRFRELHL